MSKQYPGGLITKTPVVPSGPYENSTASGIWTLDQQAYWAKLGQWPTAGNLPKDAQFNYVTTLLHGDGTNGAQNNTFLDSSTNNFTITRYGNATQGSFSPYGSNWANYFNGTSALAFPSNSAFAFDTGAYTVEMWVFITGVGSGGYSHFFNAGNATGSFGFAIYSDYSLNVFGYGTGGVIAGSANDITPNTWQHIAVCRSSTSSNATKIYVNGVLKTTGTDSTNWTVTTTPSVGGLTSLSGYSTVGYISNCRIVKGTAVYTTAFTPSTTPLTAISGTSLLTCQSNRFIDNSTNNFAITVNGTPSVQRFNPFGASTAYSTSVIGGSGYFDGSGDSLVTSGTGSFNPRSTFTVEFWTYPITNDTVDWINSNTNDNFYIETFSGTLYVGDGSANTISTTPPALNRWTHVLLSFDGTTYRLFYNGVSQATSTSLLASNTITAFRIGQKNDTSRPFNGYITDMRVLVGTALQTSAFTPPTAPLTAISNTTLLLNYTNGAIFDNAMMNDLETVGNAQISTSVVKYGTGSISLSASGNTLRTQYNNPSLSMGTGDFTIEGWVYFSSTPSINGVFQMSGTSGGFATNQTANLALTTNDASSWQIYAKNTYTISSSTTISVGSWIHFALVRSGTTTVLYIGGSALITLTSDSTNYNTPYIGLGSIYDSSSYPLGGYIDDLRITKGYARYTSNFTPPTAAFPNIGPT